MGQDGYILTNAHVVSKEMVKAFLLSEAFTDALEEKLKNLSRDEQRKIFQDEDRTEKFAEEALRLLLENSQFDFSSSLAVLDPSSQKEKVKNLFANGFPAEIIDLNESFLFSNKDVALIKINQVNLPTVNLGDDSRISVGNPVFIFGFPAAAELNNLNPVEPTLTQGVISALKFSENKDFKIFQTDAKVSQGSSGGPMFNEKGEVVGIITYQTNPVYQAIGDNFAFAVPIDLAKTLLANNHVQLESNAFSAKARLAFGFFAASQCKLANEMFNEALNAGNRQFVPENHFLNYQEACKQTIALGESFDSKAAAFWKEIKNFTAFEWFVILGRAMLIAVGAAILALLYQRIKKDEAEIKELELTLQETEENTQIQELIAKNQVVLPLPDEELHAHERSSLGISHPHLADFVKEARAIGLNDSEIHELLKNAGWTGLEITNALKL